MGLLEALGDLDEFLAADVGAEVHRGTHRGGAQIPCLLDLRKENLVVRVGIGQALVVVDLDDEGNPVRVAPADAAEHTQGRRDAVAAALDRQPDDVLGIEVDRVRRERGRTGVLDSLVHGQDRDVAGATETAVPKQPFQARQGAVVPVGGPERPVDDVGSRHRQVILRDSGADVSEEALRLTAQQFFDARDFGHGSPLVQRLGGSDRADSRSLGR